MRPVSDSVVRFAGGGAWLEVFPHLTWLSALRGLWAGVGVSQLWGCLSAWRVPPGWGGCRVCCPGSGCRRAWRCRRLWVVPSFRTGSWMWLPRFGGAARLGVPQGAALVMDAGQFPEGRGGRGRVAVPLPASSPLLAIAQRGTSTGAQSWGRFCEWHMGAAKGQVRVPLLCPFFDLLKVASAPTEKNPGTTSVPAAPLVRCQCGHFPLLGKS